MHLPKRSKFVPHNVDPFGVAPTPSPSSQPPPPVVTLEFVPSFQPIPHLTSAFMDTITNSTSTNNHTVDNSFSLNGHSRPTTTGSTLDASGAPSTSTHAIPAAYAAQPATTHPIQSSYLNPANPFLANSSSSPLVEHQHSHATGSESQQQGKAIPRQKGQKVRYLSLWGHPVQGLKHVYTEFDVDESDLFTPRQLKWHGELIGPHLDDAGLCSMCWVGRKERKYYNLSNRNYSHHMASEHSIFPGKEAQEYLVPWTWAVEYRTEDTSRSTPNPATTSRSHRQATPYSQEHRPRRSTTSAPILTPHAAPSCFPPFPTVAPREFQLPSKFEKASPSIPSPQSELPSANVGPKNINSATENADRPIASLPRRPKTFVSKNKIPHTAYAPNSPIVGHDPSVIATPSPSTSPLLPILPIASRKRSVEEFSPSPSPYGANEFSTPKRAKLDVATSYPTPSPTGTSFSTFTPSPSPPATTFVPPFPSSASVPTPSVVAYQPTTTPIQPTSALPQFATTTSRPTTSSFPPPPTSTYRVPTLYNPSSIFLTTSSFFEYPVNNSLGVILDEPVVSPIDFFGPPPPTTFKSVPFLPLPTGFVEMGKHLPNPSTANTNTATPPAAPVAKAKASTPTRTATPSSSSPSPSPAATASRVNHGGSIGDTAKTRFRSVDRVDYTEPKLTGDPSLKGVKKRKIA